MSFQRRQCSKCEEDLSFTESDPCDRCSDAGRTAGARIIELKGIIRSLLELIDAEITTAHDKWLHEKKIAAAQLAVEGKDNE